MLKQAFVSRVGCARQYAARIVWWAQPTLLFVVLALSSAAAQARDYFLIIGGGYSPMGNQVSLEKNVDMMIDLLGEKYPEGVAHDIFFSHGEQAGRDLQYIDPEREVPKANQLMALVFRNEKYLGYRYRPHHLQGLRGASERKTIEQWFAEVGPTLQKGDRLFVYFTGHGGSAQNKDKEPFNTTMFLWNNQNFTMKEFSGHLDKLSPEVDVVVVMVQCFSGGFSHVIFDGGDEAKGATPANRCGFYATVNDRVAAGCTPDINEENYQEYSSFFWAALRGKTRTGVPIEMPDYDGDGRVSFAEAHCYTLIASNSIDISVSTRDAFLRKYSRMESEPAAPGEPRRRRRGRRPQQPAENQPQAEEPPAADDAAKDTASAEPAAESAEATEATDVAEAEAAAETAPADAPMPSSEETPAPETPAGPVLLSAGAPWPILSQHATPGQRAVVEQLSLQLGITGENRLREARRTAEQIEKERKEVEEAGRKAEGEINRIAGEIKNVLVNEWPELANNWNSEVFDLIVNQSEELIQLIEKQEGYAQMLEHVANREKAEEQKLDHDRRWAKCQRIIRTLENIALAANLPQVADSETLARYERLVAAENGCLGPCGGAEKCEEKVEAPIAEVEVDTVE